MLAPAKINLMLHVVGRRADNYHQLQSLIMFAKHGDEIEITGNDGKFTICGEFSADLNHENNLICKARRMLGREEISLELNKKLPVSSGIGGGSADAAAVLRLLGKNHSREELFAIAKNLGSDVPACLVSQPLWLENAGEIINEVDIKFDIPILLINHKNPLSTAEIFKKFHESECNFADIIAAPSSFDNQEELVSFLGKTQNMLEKPAKMLDSQIDLILAEIKKLPKCQLSRMSGSGATCFGIFPDINSCQEAAEIMQNKHPQLWIKSTLLKGKTSGKT